MTLELALSKVNSGCHIKITGSKSESNRLLILKALYPEINILNLSKSDDSQVMQRALSENQDIVDIHHAGTAMRFLTSYFAVKSGKSVLLTGSERMKQRPIEILVSALKDLGADIEYTEKSGCPPLKIHGKTTDKKNVALDADVSSQYISSLMLIAPKFKDGLEIYLKGEVTSFPYIKMTLELLKSIGVEGTYKDNTISIRPLNSIKKPIDIVVESDWSSASYYYSIVALSEPGTEITLSSYRLNSLQGDSILAEIYKVFGVETSFLKNSIRLKKILSEETKQIIKLNLIESPDIAQTIAVSCLGIGLECHLEGLHTLKIKETDRLVALKNELEKFGGVVSITDNSLTLQASNSLTQDVLVETYNDHRMAMAFAPMALKTNLRIQDAMVVTKSYPNFYEDLKSIGFQIN